MADGHPQFGGSNGVTALDVGQPGGARAGAGSALLTGIQVNLAAAEVNAVQHDLPQQNAAYRDVLGFAGRRVRVSGMLHCASYSIQNTIAAELDRLKHGSDRTISGGLAAPDPTQVRETRLTDVDGTVIAARAILEDWSFTTRRHKAQTWTVVQGLDLVFRVLG